MSQRLQILVCLAAAAASAQVTTDRVSATGRIVDAESKQPIPNATVMVYSAGVRTGYDLACPTCYVDCGKRTTTNENGEFAIGNLSNNLIFNLLVVGDGYSVSQLKKVDPQNQTTPATGVLKKRTTPQDPLQTVKGKIVDRMGQPVRDAMIAQQGLIMENGGRMFGGDEQWIDPIAVSNKDGEFEMSHSRKAKGMVLEVTPRGMAPKLATLDTGGARKTIEVSDGATVRGRLVGPDGKPVANAQLALSTHTRSAGMIFRDVLIGTNDKGEFVITNVPAGRVWDLFPRMDALAPLGLAGAPTMLETRDDGQDINVGNIQMRPAHTLKGRIVLSNGLPIPAGMRVSIGADRINDRQVVNLSPDGTFEFRGLAPGFYYLIPAVKDYQPRNPDQMIEVLIEGDRSGLSVTLYPKP
jgi:protocatechuate 3,4-dioxygenase beta subunit